MPEIVVDPQTYEVRADGDLLVCEPATTLPLAQRYFLFWGKMLELTEKLEKKTKAEAKLVLPFESRQKARLKANLDDGTEVGLFLPRGDVLRNGDLFFLQKLHY